MGCRAFGIVEYHLFKRLTIVKKFISFVLVLLIIGVCIGFFRGWLSLSTNKEILGNKVDVSLKVDPDKIKDDLGAVEEKTKRMLSKE